MVTFAQTFLSFSNLLRPSDVAWENSMTKNDEDQGSNSGDLGVEEPLS